MLPSSGSVTSNTVPTSMVSFALSVASASRALCACTVQAACSTLLRRMQHTQLVEVYYLLQFYLALSSILLHMTTFDWLVAKSPMGVPNLIDWPVHLLTNIACHHSTKTY